MARKKAKKTSKAGKNVAGGSLGGAVKKGVKALTGGSGGGGKRRSRGPAYWANKVIVEKLKKKYKTLKYGSMR